MCGIGAKRILELGHKTIKSEAKKLISICITLSTHTYSSRYALDFKRDEMFYLSEPFRSDYIENVKRFLPPVLCGSQGQVWSRVPRVWVQTGRKAEVDISRKFVLGQRNCQKWTQNNPRYANNSNYKNDTMIRKEAYSHQVKLFNGTLSWLLWPNFGRSWMTIYILWWSVCLSVTKNDLFLLGVSCNHLNPP